MHLQDELAPLKQAISIVANATCLPTHELRNTSFTTLLLFLSPILYSLPRGSRTQIVPPSITQTISDPRSFTPAFFSPLKMGTPI